MTRHSNHTNANLLRKPKYVPPVHACVCYKCQTPYQGYGRICPDCSDMEREARDLERMTKNAILETRQVARSNFTDVGKNGEAK